MALTLTNIYNKLTWKNSPDHTTPINDTNLNHIETGIKNNNTGLRAAETAINNLSTAVGNTQNLDTSSKEVVGAVNELNQQLTELERRGNMPILDYANPLGYLDGTANHTSFTANTDCYIFGVIGSARPTEASISIDNQKIIKTSVLIGSASDNDSVASVPLLKVKSGSTITVTAVRNVNTFVGIYVEA